MLLRYIFFFSLLLLTTLGISPSAGFSGFMPTAPNTVYGGAGKTIASSTAKVVAELGKSAKKVAKSVTNKVGIMGLAKTSTKSFALSAPRQIKAFWETQVYKHGGLMTTIEHINFRHTANTRFKNVSKFSKGISVRNIRNYVDQALRYGKVTPNKGNAFTVEYSLGRTIGTNKSGNPASNIRIYVRDDIIQTAFPY